MNDTDSDFDERVRAMLRSRADDIEAVTSHDRGAVVPIVRPDSTGTRSWRRVTAVAAAAIAVIGAFALFRPSEDRDVSTIPSDEPSAPSGLPNFDPATAPAVFTATGDPDSVVQAYLDDRFPDYPAPGVSVSVVSVDGGFGSTDWQLTAGGTSPYGGSIFLRRDGETWGVIAATTRGVDLGDLVNDGERVAGRITSSAIDFLAVDVLDLAGEPVAAAPRPGGFPGAAYRFGTAGDSNTGFLDLDLAVVDEIVVVRVQLVGGTLLSIAEVAFVPPRADALVPG